MRGSAGTETSQLKNPRSIYLPQAAQTGPGTDAGPSTLELKGCQCQNFLILAEDSSALISFHCSLSHRPRQQRIPFSRAVLTDRRPAELDLESPPVLRVHLARRHADVVLREPALLVR